jgi:nucleotidyltransferase substrate binding protein (TIGR01987 family)
VIGSKGATREAFKNGLLADGEVWMDMIKSRNQTSHTYNEKTANEITKPSSRGIARNFRNCRHALPGCGVR